MMTIGMNDNVFRYDVVWGLYEVILRALSGRKYFRIQKMYKRNCCGSDTHYTSRNTLHTCLYMFILYTHTHTRFPTKLYLKQLNK